MMREITAPFLLVVSALMASLSVHQSMVRLGKFVSAKMSLPGCGAVLCPDW